MDLPAQQAYTAYTKTGYHGSILYLESRERRLFLMLRNPDGTVRELRRTDPGESIVSAAWMPGDRSIIMSRVVSAGGPKAAPGLWHFSIESGRLQALAIDLVNPREPSVSPDGRQLAFTAGVVRREIIVVENFLPNPVRPVRR
jgi:Tol biopolymer transport system component